MLSGPEGFRLERFLAFIMSDGCDYDFEKKIVEQEKIIEKANRIIDKIAERKQAVLHATITNGQSSHCFTIVTRIVTDLFGFREFFWELCGDGSVYSQIFRAEEYSTTNCTT